MGREPSLIRIGILGASRIVPEALLCPAAKRDDCKIVAIGCSDPRRGAEFAEMHSIGEVCSDYRELIRRDDIDLVYNALPPSRHADLSIAALEVGKAVLCEKPIAMNADEAEQMVAAATRSKGPLIEGFHYRHHPAFRHALAAVKDSAIGSIERFEAVFVAPVPYNPGDIRHTLALGGGALMDMGCYPVHWARQFLAGPPVVLNANSQCEIENIDITTIAELEFQGGVIASIECSMDANRSFGSSLTIWGSRGKLHFDNPLAPQNGHTIMIDGRSGRKTVTVAGQSTYDLQLDYTLRLMRGETTPISGGGDMLANMTAIDQIYEKAGLVRRQTLA